MIAVSWLWSFPLPQCVLHRFLDCSGSQLRVLHFAAICIHVREMDLKWRELGLRICEGQFGGGTKYLIVIGIQHRNRFFCSHCCAYFQEHISMPLCSSGYYVNVLRVHPSNLRQCVWDCHHPLSEQFYSSESLLLFPWCCASDFRSLPNEAKFPLSIWSMVQIILNTR